ncbi:unnamed protein product [Chrysodeixis includens]|uniref:Hemolin n=1 Tax=Chrysodeixis includens TaxID=689277 RepID=A0A9P0FU94_CHRIL|nr:unnamed protein product [Chrysodeixis includens]
MWDQKYPFAVLLIFAHIFKASCMGSGSLTFAIDDTGSMGDDIDQVKRGANRILDIVFNEKSSAIDNMVLVSINEPISEVRAITTDRYTFRQALDALEPHDTILNDCPEPSMTGTLLALEKSHPDSYIYVFTDASAKDSPIASQVMELCQRKQSQINFILTGVCDNRDQAPGVNVYYDVAAACSGLAFFVGPESLNPVIRTIEETINGNKTVMVTTTVPSGVITKIRFTIDDRTEYAVVYVAGSYVSLTISGSPAIIEDIMRNHNGIVVKVIKETAAGDFVATVRGARSTSVIIVGRTDFLFDYGFSKLVPKSLADTTSQPIANSDVYLSILINDPGHLVKITTAYILGMNENIISSLPLNQISTDFYITNPFTTPSEKIQIVVEGIVISTGKIIRRMSKIPITPQKPIKVEIDTMDPVVNIEEGERTEVEYDGTVKLTCKVSGYPKPEIIWTDSRGATVKSVSSILQVPYDYISYVTISNIKKGDRFECNAVNNKASDAKIIDVVVKDAFEVKSIPQGTIRVHYGSSGIITCDITSKQPMNIRWYYEDDKTRRDREIFSSNTYKISADGKQLIIKKMYLKTVGKYTCKATLTNHNDVQKIFSTRVTADGLVAPVASGEKSQKATKGSAAHIHCNVKGYPKPVISWQFKGAAAQNFVNLGNHGVYRIPSVQENHAGYYKCVAVNVIGSAAHVTTLIVQDPPKITTIHTDYYKSKEGAAVLKMPCDATGIPKPSIIWKKNGATITPNSKYSIEAGALIIKNVAVEDASSYTCEASNEVGAASATFKTIILQTPRVFGVGFKEATLGTSATIECKVFHGIPLPNITWQFKNTSSIEYQPLRESDEIKWNPQPAVVNVLKISNLTSNHTGRYKCVATNELGTTEHITLLIVQSPPKIISTTLLRKGVEGDIALRIPCTTTGEPIPTITWKVDGAIITPNTKYAVEDGALVIRNPIRNDSKSYTCEANNVLGTDSAVFKVKVNEYVGYGDKYKVFIKEGENRKLYCDGHNSNSQTVRWLVADVDLKLKEPYLYFEKATVDKDGNYTCRVSDKHGNTFTHTYVVDVGRPPKFKYANLQTVDWRGDVRNVLSNCDSEAKPLANTTWYFDGKMLSDNDLKQLENRFKWGRYSCNVFNVHGSIQRSFEVASPECYINKNVKDSEDTPLILNSDLTWPSWKTPNNHYLMKPQESIKVFCPGQATTVNEFQTFNTNSLQATCVKQDIFEIDGKNYVLKDLRCKNNVTPSIRNEKSKCLTETSEMIRVGYEVKGLLGTYDVCFDYDKNVPLYTRALLSGAYDTPKTTNTWHKYPVIADEKLDKGMACKDSLSSCCYSRTLLVNDRIFNERQARDTTFIKPLNTILQWRPCTSRMTTWENINDMVRTQIQGFGKFYVWSGTHTIQEEDGAYIPRYLWMVLKFNEENNLAIVHVNAQTPTDNDIKCRNTCNEDQQPWFTPADKFTYCCRVDEFLAEFNLKGHGIGA